MQARYTVRQIAGVPVFHQVEEDTSIYDPPKDIDRLYAFIVDSVLQASILAVIKIPFSALLLEATHNLTSHRVEMLTWVVSAIAVVLYVVVPLKLWGQTFGKRAYGIRIVPDNGYTSLSWMQVIVRDVLAKGVSGPLMAIMALSSLINEERRGFHDIFAQTRLIQYRSSE